MTVSQSTDSEMKVDVGGGKHPLPEHVNIDLRDLDEVDHVAPASELPFPDNSAARIHANSLVPHVEDLNEVMEEFSRVLEPGGELVLKATHANSTGIRADPDHSLWSWTSDTGDWYDVENEFAYYSAAHLRLVDVEVVGWLRPHRQWLRPASWAFGKLIDCVGDDIADEMMKLPFAGGRVTARWMALPVEDAAERRTDGGYDGPKEILADAIDHVAGLTTEQRETAKDLVDREGTGVAKRYVQLARKGELDA